MRRITLITTGGTMEKEYDERSGALVNRRSVVDRMLRRLRLEDVAIVPMELMHKDSMELTDEDRSLIVSATKAALANAAGETDASRRGVVIVHGTDTLATTGEWLHERVADLRWPVVLTGAMRPYELQRSDSVQNLTEALFATDLLEPGVWVVAHGRALRFPGVVKDRDRGTFVQAES
ncbi:MAG: asparaginase domain-containing protein [Planctomycetota bacterium]